VGFAAGIEARKPVVARACTSVPSVEGSGWTVRSVYRGVPPAETEFEAGQQPFGRARLSDGYSGTFRLSSSSHTSASESLGARQSLRGERDPPDPTLGPFGMAVRLNWLILKNR